MTREEKQAYLDSYSFLEQLRIVVQKLGRPYDVSKVVANYDEKIIRVYLKDPFFKERTGNRLKTSLAVVAMAKVAKELKAGNKIHYNMIEYTERSIRLIYWTKYEIPGTLETDEDELKWRTAKVAEWEAYIAKDLKQVYKHADKFIRVEVDVHHIDDIELPYIEGVVTVHVPDQYHLDEISVPMFVDKNAKITIVSVHDAEYDDINYSNAQYVAKQLPVVFSWGQRITQALLKSSNHVAGHVVVDCIGSMFEIISVFDLKDDQKAIDTGTRSDHVVCEECGFVLRQVEWWENTRVVSYNQLVKNYMFVR